MTEKFVETEWINDDSIKYEKILQFEREGSPLMSTQPNEPISCFLASAKIYPVKVNGSIQLQAGIVPVVQGAVNLADHPIIAGEYVVNNIVGRSEVEGQTRYNVDHRQMVSLDTLNHIIDLNRPDILDPQSIYDAQFRFKDIAKYWFNHGWLSEPLYKSVVNLPDEASDQINDQVVQAVLNSAKYKRALSEWREENWISFEKAKRYAIKGTPIFTVEDEISFAAEFGSRK